MALTSFEAIHPLNVMHSEREQSTAFAVVFDFQEERDHAKIKESYVELMLAKT